MSIIEIIIYSACMAFVVVDVLTIYKKVNGLLNWKPLNCNICLAGWFALFLSWFQGYHWKSVMIMSLAMVSTVVLTKILYRL